LIATIDSLGGAVQAIEKKYYQAEITDSAYAYQRAIEEREKIIVGVNAFTGDAGLTPDLLRVDERIAGRQVERLKSVRASRSADGVADALRRVKQAAAGRENMLPPILSAVEAYASVGEISDVLRSVWGEYVE